MSETIRVSRSTKEALLRIAARLQELSGRRVDIDEAINHLVQAEGRDPNSFLKFVGSARQLTAASLTRELQKERRADELRSKRKDGA